MWQLYLSIPMKEQSYVEWKNEIISKNEEKPSFEVAEDNIQNIKDKARNILKNFKPE